MAKGSLLQRIRDADSPRRTADDTRSVVLEHLRVMCTTRQGTMLSTPDYGICEVSELLHNFPDAIALMARALRNTITQYEPRLTNVRIKHVPSEDLTLRYEISGTLVDGKDPLPIRFETTVDTNRRIKVH